MLPGMNCWKVVKMIIATWYGTGFQKGVIKSTIQYPILRSRDYKTFSCSTELSIKFIMLTNTKLPTIVDILTFISWLEQHLRAWKHEQCSIVSVIVFMCVCNFYSQLSWAWKRFFNLGTRVQKSLKLTPSDEWLSCLVRILTVYSMGNEWPTPSCVQSKLNLGCTDVQAILSHRWAHIIIKHSKASFRYLVLFAPNR